MRSILLASAVIGVAYVLCGSGTAAQSEAWCSVAREGDGENCGFRTYEQCRATGIDGWCVRSPQSTPAPAPVVAPTAQIEVPAAPAPTPPARRRPGTRPASTVRPATNIVPPRPAANISIRLPDRALLAPPPEFNCEFNTANLDAGAPQQPTLASTQAGQATDVARIKADYERQCYRHAEIISRDRLRRLQASVGETVKAVQRSEQSSSKIPLPAPTLLAAPTEFNCEFKTSADDARAPPTPGPGADAAVRTKLDYELQCYRHAAIIWRDRIRQLQTSVGATIKAVNRDKQPAVEQRRGNRN
jgi:uncharacterized protein DUF3551